MATNSSLYCYILEGGPFLFSFWLKTETLKFERGSDIPPDRWTKLPNQEGQEDPVLLSFGASEKREHKARKSDKEDMGRGEGILGSRDVEQGSRRASLTSRRNWLKRRERWLVVLGVVLHAVYMLSIFDIYFKTPIVHGMHPVTPRFPAPAKRLVLLVGALIAPHLFVELPQWKFLLFFHFWVFLYT